ncbi:MAG TPA: enoyl-CoA hydratase/isomerase family protein [Candidatus Angelobacter sp.]|nr:enoyl-CoA hydratase/isomerase family protein [Candidatus Angelobacter sp.]
MGQKIRLQLTHEGQVARVTLAAPKANILDQEMMHELIETLDQLSDHANLKAIVLAGEGAHFSFGASVQEHLPEQISATLVELRRLLLKMGAAHAPLIAAVRGQCLGGALELALTCDLILAEENAKFGLPEIKLAVFPPAGAALLPLRIGYGRAAEMVLTGETWSAAQALSIGLINRVFPDGELDARLESWLASNFLPRSAAALRFAAEVGRRPWIQVLERELPVLESLYLDDLMEKGEAVEGLQAFLEKRKPSWQTKEVVSLPATAK